MTLRISQHLRLIGVCLLAAGCAEPSQSSQWSGTVDTLATGRIVVSNPDRPLSDTHWELQERIRLGSLAEEGPELFGGIGGVALGSNGEIFVLDNQAAEVRVFDLQGAFLQTLGRQGQGPGELSGAAGLALDREGTVWVMNWGNARYTGFDPASGQVHNEVRSSISFHQFPWPGTFDEAGKLFDVALDDDRKPAVLLLDDQFLPADTLRLPQPSDADQISFHRGALRIASMPEPFAPAPSWAPRARGGIVIGEGREYRLHRVGFGGDTSMTIELDRVPAEVTPAEADSALAFFLQMQESLGGATPNRRPSVRQTKPAHGSLFIDDEDRTWVTAVRREGEAPQWDVFDADGRFVSSVDIPDPQIFVRPSVRGSWIAVATEGNGFPEVVLYQIVLNAPDGPDGTT